MRKETEQDLDLAVMVEHYRDGASSPKMSKDDGENRAREKKNGTGSRGL